MGQLEGKVAVITGSTRGLGLAIAQAYAREGASVVLTGRTEADLQSIVADMQQQGKHATSIVADVGQLSEVQAIADHALQTFGAIDIWVNNAGYGGVYGSTADIAPEDFERVLRTNIFGTYYGSLVALNYFRAYRRKGKIINILGRGDRSPAPYQIAYGSSKSWVRAFTLALAQEQKKSGIGIYAINPGLMDTDLLRKVEVVRGYEGQLKRFGTIIRMWANPPEVPAERVVWLASRATDGKTGLEIQVLGTKEIVSGAFAELMRRLRRQPLTDKSPRITLTAPHSLP